MRIFNALATNEEDAVMPARRYRSTPLLLLDLVRAARIFASLRRLFHEVPPDVENFAESKSGTDPLAIQTLRLAIAVPVTKQQEQ
jgi:hypothetical protein